VFVEFSVIDNLLKEAGLGVNVALTKNIALGAVVKYQDFEDGKRVDGWLFGLEATILLGTSSESQFSEALIQ
jgi:opacity protein-like surface antigen